MSKASDVVAIATAEIGYKEKATNASLDDATANAGKADWTKYARDLAEAGYYNGNKNGYAWCDVFVDWCFFKAYGKEEGQRIECQTGTLGAGCGYSAGYYKKQDRYDTTPKIGDQVFLQANGSISHTGLVISVTNDSITTVEGNSSNQVKKNTYKRTSTYINGYGHPLYSEEDTETAVTDASMTTGTATKTEAKEITGTAVTVKLNLLTKGSTGPQVKTVQRIMRVNGIDNSLEIDGEFGELTYNAVIKLQQKLFPDSKKEWDGKVGSRTWTAMLTKLN